MNTYPAPDTRVGPQPVLDLLEAFRRSKTLFAAVQLGLFDGERPRGAAVQRLLEACVSFGLLERRGDEYVNTAIADEYLRDGSPRTLAPYVRYSNAVLYRSWGELEDAVIRGGPSRKPSALQDDQVRRDFLRGMHGTGLLSSPAVVTAFDLSRFAHAVDLGGATGHLASAARCAYPHLRVTVFDVPEMIALVRDDIADETELVAGDFHTSPLPAGDLYLLGRVLHNLRTDTARSLLRRVHDALPAGGALLLAERLLGDGADSASAHMHSLNMLVCTGGRERSREEYAGLLVDAGFRDVEARTTGEWLDAIFAVKR